jgi:VWFA-related protein
LILIVLILIRSAAPRSGAGGPPIACASSGLTRKNVTGARNVVDNEGMLRAQAIVTFACAGAVLLAQAQPPPPPPDPQPPRPTFRTGTNLVRVDATVSDDHGQPMLDLTKDEFEVTEDGAPQAIESFKLVQLTGEQDASDEESLPIRSNEHGRAEAAREEVRLFAIFLDDYHVNRFTETLRAQEALISFLRTQLGPRDLVTLMDPLTPLDALRFSRDREELVLKIKAFQGRRGVYIPTRSAAEEEQLSRAQNIERVRTEVTLSALKALVTHLGSIRESRKTVIFVSGGFGLGRDLWTEFTDVFQAASQNNTAIYPLDPGFLGMRNSIGTDVLRTLADNTGGRAIVNMNRFDKAITQIVRDSSAYYLIGYAPKRTVADGKFREIRVKVSRKGADVRARKGYWALTADEAKRAEEVTPAPPPEIAKAFSPLATSRSGRPIDAWVGVSRGDAGLMRVAFTWEARPARDGMPRDVPAAVTVTAVDASGKERFQGTIPSGPPDPVRPGEPTGSASFELPAGASKLKIQVLNRGNDMLDMEVRDIAVPDLWTPALAVSTPRVIRARDGRHFQMLAADRDAAGTPVREFRRSDRLLIRFAVYAKDAAAPTITARLVSKTGGVLATLPVAPSAATSATHQVDLPLVNLGAGDYALRIEAVSGDATVTELIALRVQ